MTDSTLASFYIGISFSTFYILHFVWLIHGYSLALVVLFFKYKT